jgi:hypothetical protein
VKKSTVCTERRLGVQAEDAGIVAGALVDQHAGIVGWRQGAQDLGELGGPSLLAQPAQRTCS